MPNPFMAGGIFGLVLGLGYLIYTVLNESPNHKYRSGNHDERGFNPGPGYDWPRSDWDDEERRNTTRQRQRRTANGQKPECAICDKLLEGCDIKRLQCRHIFHELCIKQWFEEAIVRMCPVCHKAA